MRGRKSERHRPCRTAERLCRGLLCNCPAVAVHSYGEGRAYYLASRFEEAFYRAFYRAAVKEVGLTPALAGSSADGVLAARRGTFVFVQNCNEHPVEVGGVALNRYGTAVWKNGEQVL